jgi:outer membrane protein
MRVLLILCSIWLLGSNTTFVHAQTSPADTLPATATLEECIQYALAHQVDIRQAQLDEQITDRTIKSRLADWYPQVGFNYNIQHYLQLPVVLFPDLNDPTGPRREIRTGVANSSTGAFTLNQTIFNRDVLLANRTARDVLNQAVQNTTNTKINVTVDVSKAFYDLLLTRQQQSILNAQIERLARNLKDAVNQFKSGIVDKTDYQRATIALNNANAQLKQAQEQAIAREAVLKNLMGYPVERSLLISYDTTRLELDAQLDTNQVVNYQNRIEYQRLQTRRNLLRAEIDYARWSFLPTVSFFMNYNLLYQNQEFTQLYSRTFPNSLFGLTMALPLFQGGKRLQNIKIAELQLERSDWDVTGLRNDINTEFTRALSQYKSDWIAYQNLKENVQLAREVYDIIQLQYKSGVKTYLEVIISQTDLRTAEFNYTNALYQVISSKLDVEKALGSVHY